MVIHNASFMMEREKEKEFVSWLRRELESAGIIGTTDEYGRESGGFSLRPRVSAMREAGGVDYREAEAQSVAFQVEFSTVGEAKEWNRDVFSTIAARFEEKFGPQAMVFTSIFEEIGLIG